MVFRATLVSLAVASVLFPLSGNAARVALPETPPSLNQVKQSNSWLEINLGQFKQNMAQFRSHLHSNTKLCVVMKADAYGNGIRGLMPTILELNVPCIAIASNAEVRAVRDGGFKGQLVRVRSADIDEIKQVLDLDVEELVGSAHQASQIKALNLKKPVKVHLALNDGGMSRNGIDMTTEAGKLEAVELANSEAIDVVGIMTHFPNYDAGEVRSKLDEFKQSSSWLIENSKLHHVPANSTVGYDSSFTTQRDSVLANLPVGYSDGYPRKMGNTAYVIVNGQRAPVVGKTSMNTSMVDVTDVKGVSTGQEVTLFGKQAKEQITIG